MRTSWPLIALSVCVCSCDSSRDKLLAELQSTRPNERALAVKKLAQQEKPEDLVLFTRAAKDLAAIVRGEAANALGKSQDPRVVDLLGELLEDPDSDVQAKAAMALAAIKNDKAKAYLTLQYARQGRGTRVAIVQALKAANVPGAMAQVVVAEAKELWDRNLAALQSGSPPERVAAAEELGKSGRVEAVNRLTQLLKDNQVIIAAAAVRGLGFAGDQRAAPAIASLLGENFPELREAACDALSRLQDESALPQLKAIAIEHSATSPFATAALIGLPKDEKTSAVLCDVALDGAEAEALAAGREMRTRGGCPEAAVLERFARARDAASQVQALQGVVALGPTAKGSTAKVLPLLGSADAHVRAMAVRAAAELGDTSLVPAVQKVYDQELKTVRAMRAKWIDKELPRPESTARASGADSKDEKTADLLQRAQQLNQQRLTEAGKIGLEVRAPAELVDDVSEEQTRPLAGALRALGILKAANAQSELARFVDDPSANLRAAADSGLVQLGPDGIALARRGLVDGERDVQGAVAEALAHQGAAGQQPLLDALTHLTGDKLRLLEALRDAGPTAEAAPALISVVHEGGPEAAPAAQMLGELKSRAAVDGLMKYLDDPTGIARRDVLIALGRISDGKAADVVARDLYHDSPDVRAAAATALITIGSGAQYEPLDALKGDYYRRVRESAEAALTKIGGGTAESRK